MRKKRSILSILGTAGAVLILVLARHFVSSVDSISQPTAPPSRTSASQRTPASSTVPSSDTKAPREKSSTFFGDESDVLAAIKAHRSGVLAIVNAKVFRLLPDDTSGIDHQRFLVELRGGQTLLVAHNTDLAEKVPVKVGDVVELAGQYEWNEQGGIMHWTHHDPGKRRPDGWIKLGDRKYQ